MEQIFKTFFIGGYECADHINRSGERINLLTETAHNTRVREDYELLKTLGIDTVREGICWSSVERQPFKYDFREVLNRIHAAEEFGIQQIWDICHFGFPDDLSPTHPKFTERFEAICKAFTFAYKAHSDQPLFVIPINEISFLSWHAGEVRGTVPFAINSGFDIKYHLCRAAMAGIRAIKELDPWALIIVAEPLIRIHPGKESIITTEIIELNEHQYQAIDIITGRSCAELGGEDLLVDVIGCNYYYNNQWEHGGHLATWPEADERRVPLCTMLQEVQERYNRPVLLAETGHFGSGRAQWVNEIVRECKAAINLGVDLQGICLYPVIDRPDWDNLSWYHNSGIWDIDSVTKERIANHEYIEAIQAFM